jgi:hypothetical protein
VRSEEEQGQEVRTVRPVLAVTRQPRAIWVEDPHMYEFFGAQVTAEVFVPEDDDDPDVIYVPDHQAGGFRAQSVAPPKRRLGF